MLQFISLVYDFLLGIHVLKISLAQSNNYPSILFTHSWRASASSGFVGFAPFLTLMKFLLFLMNELFGCLFYTSFIWYQVPLLLLLFSLMFEEDTELNVFKSSFQHREVSIQLRKQSGRGVSASQSGKVLVPWGATVDWNKEVFFCQWAKYWQTSGLCRCAVNCLLAEGFFLSWSGENGQS